MEEVCLGGGSQDLQPGGAARTRQVDTINRNTSVYRVKTLFSNTSARSDLI